MCDDSYRLGLGHKTWNESPEDNLQCRQQSSGDAYLMSYHEQMRKLNPLVIATKMTPEQINIMVKFAKVARRSARQNTVLHTMVEELIEGTDMEFQTYEAEGRDGKKYTAWRVVKKGEVTIAS